MSEVRAVREQASVEGVHRARVALRRIRAYLREFRPVLDATWAADLRAHLREYHDLLGAARDADVALGRCESDATLLADGDTLRAASVIADLRARRDAARARLCAFFEEREADDTLALLRTAARVPRFAAEAPLGTAALRAVLKRSWRRLRRRATTVDPVDRAALHDVRIRAKRTTYVAEACTIDVGARARKLAKRSRAVQRLLGDVQDAIILQRVLRSDDDVSSAAGDIAALAREREIAALERWPAMRERLHERRRW